MKNKWYTVVRESTTDVFAASEEDAKEQAMEQPPERWSDYDNFSEMDIVKVETDTEWTRQLAEMNTDEDV